MPFLQDQELSQPQLRRWWFLVSVSACFTILLILILVLVGLLIYGSNQSSQRTLREIVAMEAACIEQNAAHAAQASKERRVTIRKLDTLTHKLETPAKKGR